jgi:hypothetical protein
MDVLEDEVEFGVYVLICMCVRALSPEKPESTL